MLFKALRYSSLLGFADDLAFERFNGVLQVFDKLAHKLTPVGIEPDYDVVVRAICFGLLSGRVDRQSSLVC
jgi:hypothetical protein